MAKSQSRGGGPFDAPTGQACLETPDGVTGTFGDGEVRNSLTNANYVCGGYDGHGYGWKPDSERPDGIGMMVSGARNRDRLRIG